MKTSKGGEMMERLTERGSYGYGDVYVRRNDYVTASKKLCEYEELEEQGLLLRLPCKVGSILYQPTSNGINEYYTIGLCFNIPRNKFMYEVTYNVGLDWYKTTCDFDYINDVVFLTREEAENKLKEMEILKEQDK